MKTVAEILQDAKRTLEKVCARFDDQVEKVAQVAAVIDRVAQAPLAAGVAGDVAPAAPRSLPAAAHALREAARGGALALALAWNVDGSAEVRVNGGQPFHLQAKPAALLRIIAAPGGRDADDGMVGWRAAAEVAAALGKATDRLTTPRSVTQTVYNLRRAFRAAGQNWFLIQTDRRGAVRFALRIDAGNVPAHRQDDGGARW